MKNSRASTEFGVVSGRREGTSHTLTFLFFASTLLIELLLLAPQACAARTEKIINGTSVFQGAFPYTVSFSPTNSDPSRSHFCGGVLVHPQYVLTAAHCVAQYVSSPSAIQVVTGRTTLSSPKGEIVPVTEISVFPRYKEETIENDVAMVRLVHPVQLPTIELIGPKDYQAVVTPGTKALLLGWGSMDPAFPVRPDTLQHAVIPVIDDRNCSDRLGIDFNSASMLCAGVLSSSSAARDGVDSCYGDSGGPLLLELGGSYRVLGLSSWGYECGSARYWGVYTRLAPYVDWIRSFSGLGPKFLEPPIVEGTPRIGSTLKCHPGLVGGENRPSYYYEWKNVKSNRVLAEGKSEYHIHLADVGREISCTITARGRLAHSTASSVSLAPVEPVLEAVSGAPVDGLEKGGLCEGSTCHLFIRDSHSLLKKISGVARPSRRCLSSNSCLEGKRLRFSKVTATLWRAPIRARRTRGLRIQLSVVGLDGRSLPKFQLPVPLQKLPRK